MDKHDWSDLGEEIKRQVQTAIDSQDFKQLNETIKGSVSSVWGAIQSGFSGFNNNSDKEYHRPVYGNSKDAEQRRPVAARFNIAKRNTLHRAGGLAMAITGYILAGGMGLAILILMIVALVGAGFHAGIIIALAVLTPLTVVSGIMGKYGGSMLSRIKRMNSYTKYLEREGRGFCSIRELAASTGRSEKFIRKDIRKMLEDGMLTEGYLNPAGTCFLADKETYQQFLKAEQQLKDRERQRVNETPPPPEDSEVEQIVKTGNQYLAELKACREAIDDKAISEKISKIETVVKMIFDRALKQPEVVPDLRKMMEYYLPTTLKLLKAYDDLEEQPVQGANITNSRHEIEETLDTLNKAFEALLDKLFKDVAWDISSDITVLQTLLAQEGLTEKDF